MYDHIGLRVGNLDASVRFYTAALAPLGYVLCSRDDSGAGFGPKGAPALWLHLHKGSAGTGRACRVPRHRPRRDQEISCRRAEGRRPRQWRRRAARGLQPDLLRGVPDRSRRQQCRGGLYVAHARTAVIASRGAHSEACALDGIEQAWIAWLGIASTLAMTAPLRHLFSKENHHGFHPQRHPHRRHPPTTSGTRCAISARCIRGWCRAS